MIAWTIHRAFGIVAVAVWLTNYSDQGAQRGIVSSAAWRMVTPAVGAVYRVRHEGPDRLLDLLVLLRGAPGWMRQSGGGGGGAGFNSSLAPRSNQNYDYQFISFGDVYIEINWDMSRRVVRLGDHEISLARTNVALFDNADSPDGPTLVVSRRVNPSLPGSADPVALVVDRSRELYEFLRCDAKMTDAALQAENEMMCAQLRLR